MDLAGYCSSVASVLLWFSFIKTLFIKVDFSKYNRNIAVTLGQSPINIEPSIMINEICPILYVLSRIHRILSITTVEIKFPPNQSIPYDCIIQFRYNRYIYIQQINNIYRKNIFHENVIIYVRMGMGVSISVTQCGIFLQNKVGDSNYL